MATVADLAQWRAFVAVQEHIGYNPAPVMSHNFVGGEGSTRNRSRRNLGLYYDRDLPPPVVSWVDLAGTWPRTAKKAKGDHEPRSILCAMFGRLLVVVWHQAPDVAGRKVREEVWEAASEILEGHDGPTLMLGDANDRREEGRGGLLTADDLAFGAGGAKHGWRVDCAITRGPIRRVGLVDYEPIPGVKDHKAFTARFQVPKDTIGRRRE